MLYLLWNACLSEALPSFHVCFMRSLHQALDLAFGWLSLPFCPLLRPFHRTTLTGTSCWAADLSAGPVFPEQCGCSFPAPWSCGIGGLLWSATCPHPAPFPLPSQGRLPCGAASCARTWWPCWLLFLASSWFHRSSFLNFGPSFSKASCSPESGYLWACGSRPSQRLFISPLESLPREHGGGQHATWLTFLGELIRQRNASLMAFLRTLLVSHVLAFDLYLKMIDFLFLIVAIILLLSSD